MGKKLFAKTRTVEMHVYLSGGQRFMPEHFLYCPEVGAAFKKMRGERMPQSVRTYLLPYPGGLGKTAHHVEDHDTRHLASAPVEEKYVFASFLYFQGIALRKILLNQADRKSVV